MALQTVLAWNGSKLVASYAAIALLRRDLRTLQKFNRMGEAVKKLTEEEYNIAEEDRECIEAIGDLCFAAGLSTPDGTVLPMIKQLISEREGQRIPH